MKVEWSRVLVVIRKVHGTNPAWPAFLSGTKFGIFAKWFAKKDLSSFLVNGSDFEEQLGHEHW